MAVLLLADFDCVEVQCPDLYGVSTHIKILKLAYLLNSHPDFELEKVDDLCISEHGESHVMYQLRHLDVDSDFYLIKNKGHSELLLKNYKSFDFILTSNSDKKYIEEIMEWLGNLNEVSICFALTDISEKDKIKFEQLL